MTQITTNHPNVHNLTPHWWNAGAKGVGLKSLTREDRQVESERAVFGGGYGSVHGSAVEIRAKVQKPEATEVSRGRDAVERMFNRSLGS